MTPKNRDELVAYIDAWFEKRGMSGYGNAVMHLIEEAGIAFVPVGPTKEMLDQVTEYHSLGSDGKGIDPVFWLEPEDWRAMLAVSPFAKEE